MANRKSIQYMINFIVFILCGIIAFMGTNSLRSLTAMKSELPKSIEREWRNEAKITLASTTVQFNNDINDGTVNPNDNLSLQIWAKRNISALRNGGQTGDSFMIRIYYENGKLVGKFIWDSSPDCAKPSFIINGRYLSDEPQMHQDVKQAEYIISQMLLGQSTLNTDKNYWWQFDDAREYLEWDVVPTGVLGFSEEPLTVGGVSNDKYNKILICLGTQEDEVQSIFTNQMKTLDESIHSTELVVYGSIFISLFNMIIYLYLVKKIKVIN